MPKKFRVVKLLSAEHWKPFHALLADRRMTVDGARAWLLERGYVLSRSAVWNYIDYQRGGKPAVRVRRLFGSCTDAELRRKVADWLPRLHGRELSSLAMFAAFMLTTSREKQGEAGRV